jgi:hypothetical protein
MKPAFWCLTASLCLLAACGRAPNREAANIVNPIADVLRDMADLIFWELGQLSLGMDDEFVLTIKPRLCYSDLQYVGDLLIIEGMHEQRPLRGINVRCESCLFSQRREPEGTRCYLPEPLGSAGGKDVLPQVCEQYRWDRETGGADLKAIIVEGKGEEAEESEQKDSPMSAGDRRHERFPNFYAKGHRRIGPNGEDLDNEQGYKRAKGVIPWKEGDEKPEDTIARIRGRGKESK